MAKRFDGKIVLLTGGASGIGRATLAGLVQEGARVAFTDINADAGRALERELVENGADALFMVSDARDEDQVRAMLAQTMSRFGRLDIAINNVGDMGEGDSAGTMLHETTAEALEGTLAAILKCTFYCMKHEILQMLSQGGGVIANTSSVAGFRVTQHGSAAYAPAKAGVIHLTQHAAVLYARDKIRVNVVAPGMTATAGAIAALGRERGDQIAADFHPIGRMVTPEEVASAFLWVCSDEASAVTGLTIPVDGGWAAR